MAFNRIIEASIGPAGQTGKLFKDIRITFDVLKTLEATPNAASIKIYNLALSTCLEFGKVDNKIILKAGYEDEGGSRNLFFGDITRANIERQETERILSIDATAGSKDTGSINISLSFGEFTNSSIILDQIIASLGIPRGDTTIIQHRTYYNGFSFIGKAKDALNIVLTNLRYRWFIDNEQLFIFKSGQFIENVALILSSDSGLIDAPQSLEDKDGEQVTENVPKRYSIKTLLFPQLVPGSSVRIKSPTASGDFIIETVKFMGDNWDGDFMAESEVRQL